MVSQDEFIDAAVESDADGHPRLLALRPRRDRLRGPAGQKCIERGLEDIVLYVGGNLVVGQDALRGDRDASSWPWASTGSSRPSVDLAEGGRRSSRSDIATTGTPMTSFRPRLSVDIGSTYTKGAVVRPAGGRLSSAGPGRDADDRRRPRARASSASQSRPAGPRLARREPAVLISLFGPGRPEDRRRRLDRRPDPRRSPAMAACSRRRQGRPGLRLRADSAEEIAELGAPAPATSSSSPAAPTAAMTRSSSATPRPWPPRRLDGVHPLRRQREGPRARSSPVLRGQGDAVGRRQRHARSRRRSSIEPAREVIRSIFLERIVDGKGLSTDRPRRSARDPRPTPLAVFELVRTDPARPSPSWNDLRADRHGRGDHGFLFPHRGLSPAATRSSWSRPATSPCSSGRWRATWACASRRAGPVPHRSEPISTSRFQRLGGLGRGRLRCLCRIGRGPPRIACPTTAEEALRRDAGGRLRPGGRLCATPARSDTVYTPQGGVPRPAGQGPPPASTAWSARAATCRACRERRSLRRSLRS
ncbi:MAG: hypothetical protein MZW92_01605 [Comamonadaceae bacterium]|nr:hypothetical protein [Comamonadaceae bacterium]